MIFDQAHISWAGVLFPAISGGYGKGPIPKGKYRILWNQVVPPDPNGNWKGKPGFAIDGFGFFLKLESPDGVDRSGFGVHLDGGPKGSRGCPVMQLIPSKLFWAAVEQRILPRDEFFEVIK